MVNCLCVPFWLLKRTPTRTPTRSHHPRPHGAACRVACTLAPRAPPAIATVRAAVCDCGSAGSKMGPGLPCTACAARLAAVGVAGCFPTRPSPRCCPAIAPR
jgi:hypothetical protein